MKDFLKLYALLAALFGMFAASGLDTVHANEAAESEFVKKTRPYLWFPEGSPNSEHGSDIDEMIIYVHVLMLVLFVGWSVYFIYALYRFRKSKNPTADYHGFRSKIPTTIAEGGVILAEVVLIIAFAIPLWAKVVDADKFPQEGVTTEATLKANGAPHEIEPKEDGLYMLHLDSASTASVAVSDEENNLVANLDNTELLEKLSTQDTLKEERRKISKMIALKAGKKYSIKATGNGANASVSKMPTIVVRVIAEQFKWNGLYSGFDGIYGRQEMKLATVENPLGRVPDTAEGLDDFVVEKVVVPEGVSVITHISSKDVIHCFKVIPIRVCQDAIPGLQIPVHFKARREMKTWITCAQLCGDGHAAMRGDFEVLTQKDFADWWNQNSGWWLKDAPVSEEVATAAQD
ncbi:MAG: hypothetical protein CMO66_00180 [Verrucomicrobiales bacterium]|nr:hypothetical protein [Verrucomicrobiales bacterium]|tara:strand:+ start:784 stop:1995 length:1212 start_codon:yes stop_codon:yes gene_type:complete